MDSLLVESYKRQKKNYPGGSYFDEPYFYDSLAILLNTETKLCTFVVTDEIEDLIEETQQTDGEFILVTAIDLHPDYDESAQDVRCFLQKHYAHKRVNDSSYKLYRRDIYDINELFYHIEGEGIHDAFISEILIENL